MTTLSFGRLQATDIVSLRKAALAAVGYNAAKVAAEMGLARQTVGMVINGKATSARVEEKVAEITGHPREKLFPAKAA